MICREWNLTGSCKFGNQCHYLHNAKPATVPNDFAKQPQRGEEGICINFLNKGFCKFGESCKYKHERRSTDVSHQQPLPTRQNPPVVINNYYQQPRGGIRLPQSQQPIQNQAQVCITDVAPRIFPPPICEEFFYTSNCRYGERCRAFHISERQLIEINQNNKISQRNVMRNDPRGMMSNNQYNQPQQSPQQQQYQQPPKQHQQHVNYNKDTRQNAKQTQSLPSTTINPNEIINFYKEKSIAEINSFTVDNLSNFTPDIEVQIATEFSNIISKIDYQHNSHRGNNNNNNMKQKLLAYYNLLKLLIGRYGIEFINKMNFRNIRSFLSNCINSDIDVSYSTVLYIQLLDNIRVNPMKIDSEKSEEENRKTCEEYIEKFGNRLCDEFKSYNDATRYADHFKLDSLKQRISLMKLINNPHIQIYEIYKELKKCNQKLRERIINELFKKNDFGGYIRFFSHLFNIENSKDFRKSNYINQYLKLSEDIEVKFISTVDDINTEVQLFSSFPSSMIVGFDMEWKPVRQVNVKEVPSILQLAINKHVVIIDLLEISKNNLFDSITSLLNVISEKHILTGSGLDDDMKKLKALIPSIKDKKFNSIDFNKPNFLNTLKKSNIKISGSSLQNLSISLIGCNLDKSETMSNWENRPLTDKQLQYAAVDAHVALHICEEVFKLNESIKNSLKLPDNVKVFVNQENDEIIEHKCLISDNEEYSYNEEIIVDNSNTPPIPDELLDYYGESIPKECFKYVPVDEKLYNEKGIAYLAQLLSKYFNVSKECVSKTEIWDDNGAILTCISKIDDNVETMAISADFSKPAEKIKKDELIKNDLIPYNLPILDFCDIESQILISDSLTFNRNMIVSTGFDNWYMNIDLEYLMDYNADICVLDSRYFDKKRF